jgi:hypothetical protein
MQQNFKIHEKFFTKLGHVLGSILYAICCSYFLKKPRVFIVTDAVSILHNVRTFIDSISNEKYLLKKRFFEEQAMKAAQEQGGAVANAFRTWSSQYNIPVGDVNVLMSFLGSLENIMLATSAAVSHFGTYNPADTKCVLNTIPIQDSSKRALITLFHGEQEKSHEWQHSHAEAHEKNIIASSRPYASFYGNNNVVDTCANELDKVPENHEKHMFITRDLTSTAGEVVGANNCTAQELHPLQHQQQVLLQPRYWNGVALTPAMAESRHFSSIPYDRADFRNDQVGIHGNSRPPISLFNHNRNNTINMPPWHRYQQQHWHCMNNRQDLPTRVKQGLTSTAAKPIVMSNNWNSPFTKDKAYSLPNATDRANENIYPNFRSLHYGQGNAPFHPTNHGYPSYL